MKIVPILIALIIVTSGRAEASFVDDQSELNSAISELRSAIGKQPRVYKMWIGPGDVTVDHDPNLEAMLFDLDQVAFSELPKLEKSAMRTCFFRFYGFRECDENTLRRD